MKKLLYTFFQGLPTLMLISTSLPASAQTTILLNPTLIDGSGSTPHAVHNLVIKGDKVVAIDAESTPKGSATTIDMTGKYLMPLINDCHAHLGILKDTTMSSANYTPENIHRHLLRFETYGVGAVQCLGTDHMDIFPLRQASRHDSLTGATIYTAGRGFGPKGGMPPVSYGMDQVFRPETPEEARKNVREIAAFHPR